MILQISDFVNEYQLSIDQQSENEFLSYVDAVEAEFMRAVFGVELGMDFVNQLKSGEISEPLARLLNEYTYKYGATSYYSAGIHEALKSFFYVKWQSIHVFINTMAGNVRPFAENVEHVNIREKMIQMQDKCISIVSDLHQVCTDFPFDYAGFVAGYPFKRRWNILGI
jgi:hypothetical protein